MRKKKRSVRLAKVLSHVSQKFESVGAVKTALWLEKRAESFDESLAANNFVKRF